MSSKYLQSIQEVREWLSYKKLDEFIYILLDNGYDDLSAIALSNNEEMIELEKLFADGETRKAIHVLVESLRSIGIDAYRKQKNDFRRLTTTVYENEQNPTSSMAWNSSEQKAIETRKNRFSSAVKPAHAYAHVNKEGYLSIRVGGDSGSWSDKFVVVKGTELKIYSSRRDMINSELSLNLLGAVTNVTKPDLTTLIISTNLSNAKKIELQCSNKMEHQEWFEAFTALQVKNDNLSPPSNPAKMEKRGSISGKRACAVEDCNLSAFGKGPYCSQHQNQYRRGSSSQKKESELSPESKSTPELKTSMLETKSVFEAKPLTDKPFMSPPVKELPAVPIASPKVSGLSQALANSGRQQKPVLPSRPAGEPSNMNGVTDKRLPSPALAAVALAAKTTYPPASPQGPGQGFMNANVAPAVAFTPISIIDEIIEDDKRFDRSSYEGVIAAVARIRARQALSLCVWDPIDENELERRLRGRGENVHEKKVKTYLKLLAEGAIFKKYKHGNSSKRLIWCTPLFDYVIWSDEEKQTVKGFIKTSEIQEINQGFGKNKCRLYIVSSGRTLELEAKDAAMAKEWKGLFEFLIQSNMNELEARNEFKQRESFGTLVNSVRMEYKKLLEEGDVFKKWPGKKIIQKGGFQHRKINCDDRVERLQWAEIETGKLKGFILFDDIVCVEEDPNDKLKFTIFAMDRSLDLEAKSVWVRQKWLRALRFFIEFKRTK